jgi:hypothetical protein
VLGLVIAAEALVAKTTPWPVAWFPTDARKEWSRALESAHAEKWKPKRIDGHLAISQHMPIDLISLLVQSEKDDRRVREWTTSRTLSKATKQGRDKVRQHTFSDKQRLSHIRQRQIHLRGNDSGDAKADSQVKVKARITGASFSEDTIDGRG